MANGLRKVIKKARRRFNISSKLTNRSRFGTRLKVEELEERIAPAAFTLGAGEYIPYDTDNGIGILYNAGATDVSVTVTDGGGAGDADSITIDCNNAGAVELRTNAPLTSGAAGTAVITDSANVTLTLATGVANTDMNLTGDGASTPTVAEGFVTTYFDGAADPGTNAALAAATAATRTAAQVEAASDTGANLTGAITLDNTTSALTSLTVQNNGTGSDAETFTGALTTAGNVGAVTIDGTATGAWTVGGDITGTVNVGTFAATTDLAVTGDITGNIASTVGAIGGDIIATGSISGNITGATGISGAITADDISGNITATTGDISGAITTTGATTNGAITGSITATAGAISGNITTSDGDATTDLANVADITATAGAITGTITIDGDLTNLDAGGAVSGDINVDGTIGDLDIGGVLSSTITAADGFTGANARTIAGISSTGGLVATTGGFANAGSSLTISGTGLAGTITATAGDITSPITISAGGIAATGSIKATAGDIDGAIAVTGGVVAGATISAGTNIDGAITIATGDFAGTVTATTGNIGNVTLTDVTAGTADGSITSAASFTAGGTIGTLTSDGNFAADVTSGGTIAGIVSTDGGITADSTITAGGTIGQLSADTNESIAGAGKIAASVTTTSGNITTIDAGSDITGTLTAAGTIGTVTTDGQLTGVITAGTGITGAVQIDTGITSTGELRATTGDIAGNITISAGGMAGLIKAVAGDITGTTTITDGGLVAGGTIEAGNDIGGAINIGDAGAGVGLAGTVKADNDISGAISVTAGGVAATGTVQAANDISGGIAVTAGGFNAGATIAAGGDISGNITATAGDIAANITAGVDISGNITATAGAVTGTVKATAGDLSGNVTAGSGNITSIVVGGDITGSTIRAEDDITNISVTGAITGPTTITASFADSDATGDIGTVTAGGGISTTMSAINIGTVRSGGLVGNDIAGTITATDDIDLIDAGAGTITATVTAGVADGSSPLATFISGGYSYAVWAITGAVPAAPTEPTIDTGVTAKLVFDGGPGTPTLDISKLADSTAATKPSIYVTTRTDSGAIQLFHDADVDVYNAPVTVTVGADSPIALGTLSVEGSYANIGGDSDITADSVQVEGGAGGTIAVAAGENITFGWVAADLNINVAAGAKAGDLILKGSGAPGSGAGVAVAAGATITVNGSLGNIYLGDSSAGFVGDLGTAAGVATIDTATNGGSIDNIYIDGTVYGNVRATSIGDVQVDGNFGSNIASNIAWTATTGNFGELKVDGNIGGDAAQTVTIQATASTGSIGNISATGNIGGTLANSVTVAAGNNIGGVQADGNIGDATRAITITASQGTIGSVTAGGAAGVNATITAGSNIGTVSATNPTGGQGNVLGTILSLDGNIGTVSTYEGTIAADITATNGNIGQVTVMDDPADAGLAVDAGNVTGAIKAGGDINTIVGANITGTVIAGAATAASPVTTFTYGAANETYSLIGTAGPLYGYTFDGATKAISVTIDNWDGTAARTAGAIDLSLTTTNALTGKSDDAQFTLSSLDFTSASITNGADKLGTVVVEGPVSIMNTGTLSALFAEGNVQGPIWVDDSSAASPVTAFSAASVTGVADPSLAQMQAVFADPDATAVVFGAPADPTTFDFSASNTGGEVSFAFGTATGLAGTNPGSTSDTPLKLGTGLAAGEVEDYQVTVSGGAITAVNGTFAGTGGVSIDGDLTYPIAMEQIGTVTITGNVTATGSLAANNIGNVTIGTPVANYIAQNGDFADAAAAQTWLDGNGNFAGTITSTQVVENGAVVLAGGIGTVTIYGDYTGAISADGNVGAVTVGQSYTAADGTKVAQSGDMTGTLNVGGNLTSLTAEKGVVTAPTSFIAVHGNSGAITSTDGNIGGSGIIAVGGSLTNITALAGDVKADIFIGGNAGDNVVIQGLGISGDLAIGTSGGVDSLTLNVLETPTDATAESYVINDGVDQMMVEVPAGGVTDTGLTVSSVTLLTDSDALALTANNDANVTLNELVVLTNTNDNLDVTMNNGGSLGTVVASNDITTAATNPVGKSTDQVESLFLAAYNAAEGTNLSFDVIGNDNPTTLDALLNNTGNIDLDFGFVGDAVTGGVIASGDLQVGQRATVDVNSFGYMVSLNGTLDATITANNSVGDMAASSNLTANIDTEGVVALGVDTNANGTIDMQEGVTAYGLNGLDNWFAGGILSEAGNVVANISADATGQLTNGVMVSGDDALGTIYARLGNVSGTLTLGGNWGGVQAPLGNVNALTVDMPYEANIDRVVAPQTIANIAGSHPNPKLSLVNDEVLVTATTPYDVSNGGFQVTATGNGTVAWLDNIGATSTDVYVIDGLAAGASINVAGDIDDLTVDGNWAGTVSVTGNAQDATTGVIHGTVAVQGDIDAATADLTAQNFNAYVHNGNVLNDQGDLQFVTPKTNAAITSNTLDKGHKSISFTNLAGDEQTLFLDGSKAVTAKYETFFGKVTSLDITGRGKVSLASVNDTLNASSKADYKTLKSIAKNAAKGSSTLSDGTANIGNINYRDWGGKANFNGVVVDGSVDNFVADGNVKNTRITGTVGQFDVSRSINQAFIGGSVTELNSDKISNVTVNGNVTDLDSIKATRLHITGNVTDLSGHIMSRVSVDGTVNSLDFTGYNGHSKGKLINSRFGQVNAENIDNRKWLQNNNNPNADVHYRNINPAYNPVTVKNTSVGNLGAWNLWS